ncbi:MAG: lipoyl domain-containing protein [Lachnospiraceae bacterium]|nr:lipoyl domain-containing protein [Candidatus Equihabitans merdae]
MRVPIVVPESAFPKKDPEHPCPCQDRPVHLTYKSCAMMWTVAQGAAVKEGDVVAEGEVEKKALEFYAPADGILVERCVEDDEEFTVGDILGYISVGE